LYKESLRVKGEYIIQLIEKDKVVKEIRGKNLVVNSGLDNIAKLIGNIAGGVGMTEIAVGSSGAPPSNSDISLGLEVARKASTNQKLSDVGKVQFQTTFLENEANTTLREAGLFNSNVMLNRIVFPDEIRKNNSQKLTVIITITVSR